MEAVNLKKKQCKIVVAVDESAESMYALSWCLSNLMSQATINTIVLLYVKPPPPVYSSLDVAGYIFSGDVIRALEAYGNDLVNSVMGRAEDICGKFSSNQKEITREQAVQDLKKEVLFLGELEEVLEATQSVEFQRCMVPLFKQIARCLNSLHFQI